MRRTVAPSLSGRVYVGDVSQKVFGDSCVADKNFFSGALDCARVRRGSCGDRERHVGMTTCDLTTTLKFSFEASVWQENLVRRSRILQQSLV